MGAFLPAWIQEAYLALSTKVQANMATVIGDVNFDIWLSVEGYHPPSQSRKALTDRGDSGRGTPFASPAGHKRTSHDADMDITVNASSLMTGWAASMCLGGYAAPTNPAPGVYNHVFTMRDPTVSKDARISSAYSQLGADAAYQKKICAVTVARFTLRGNRRGGANDALQLTCSLISSGEMIADPVTIAAPTAQAFLDAGGVTFNFGAQGSPVDLSERLDTFELSFDQDINLELTRIPGSGLYRGRMWRGPNMFAGFTADLFLDSADADILDAADGDTILEAEFDCQGELIDATYFNYFKARWPSFRLVNAPFKDVAGYQAHTLVVDRDTVYSDTGSTPASTPIVVTVQNALPAYLAAAA